MSDVKKYDEAVLELEEYSAEMSEKYQWLVQKAEETRKEKVNQIPRGELRNEQEYDEADDISQHPEKINSETGIRKAESVLHYKEYEQAVPVLTISTARTAAKAIRELQRLKETIPPYVVTYIDDLGNRRIEGALSMKEAQSIAEAGIKECLDDLYAESRMQEVFIDMDGTEGPFKATPMEYVADDESMKPEAEVKGKIHIQRSEDHFILYNELDEKTYRWDIYEFSKSLLSPMERTEQQEESVESVADNKGKKKGKGFLRGFIQKGKKR